MMEKAVKHLNYEKLVQKEYSSVIRMMVGNRIIG